MQEAKGRTNKQKTQTNATTKHKSKKPQKPKQPQPHDFPLQQVKQVKQVRQELRPSKKLVQLCYERQTFFTREDGIHTNISRTFAGEGQVPENDQANQTTKQHKNQKPPPKTNPNKKTTTKQTKATEPAFHPGET